MKKILIFSGTTEGRKLAGTLSDNGIECLVCVATEYGEYVMPRMEHVKVHVGRMDLEQMTTLMKNEDFTVVVDATHPFATAVSATIQSSAKEAGLPVLRLKRKSEEEQYEHFFASTQECAETLSETEGNILLTTGSKELAVYCQDETVRSRLFVRVLPAAESLDACEKNGIFGRQILAMQGPFGVELNRALIRQFGIRILVTKETGCAGGFQEKVQAAAEEGAALYVIGNPERGKEGRTFAEVCREISERVGVKIKNRLYFIGAGMGDDRTFTIGGKEILEESDYIFGAPRLIRDIDTSAQKMPYYLERDIFPQLDTISGEGAQIAVIFSGDTGFYSGCKKLYDKAQERTDCEVSVLPGISSVSALAALTGYSWEDAAIISIHGHRGEERWKQKLLFGVRHHEKTFVLMSGAEDVRMLGTILTEGGLKACEVRIGYNLSYPEQSVTVKTAAQCMEIDKKGLYVCLVRNPQPEERKLCPGMPDAAFIRDKVPMTKEEIREISLCKLGLTENSIVYDIGSGTGSIAVEMAALSPEIEVYAFEKKPQALELMQKNKEKFQLHHMTIVPGEASEVITDPEVPTPTHAFIGGSGGKLDEILTHLYEKKENDTKLKVVLNAITLQTVAEMEKLKQDERVKELEIIQVQVNRAREVGRYQMMEAENAIYICSFTL